MGWAQVGAGNDGSVLGAIAIEQIEENRGGKGVRRRNEGRSSRSSSSSSSTFLVFGGFPLPMIVALVHVDISIVATY